MRPEAVKICRDRFSHVGESFGTGRTLCYATRQGRNLSNKNAILIPVNPDSKLHSADRTTKHNSSTISPHVSVDCVRQQAH